MIHDDHKKRCIKLAGAIDEGYTSDGMYYNADIDFWHCLDCDTAFIHNWRSDTTDDIKIADLDSKFQSGAEIAGLLQGAVI